MSILCQFMFLAELVVVVVTAVPTIFSSQCNCVCGPICTCTARMQIYALKVTSCKRVVGCAVVGIKELWWDWICDWIDLTGFRWEVFNFLPNTIKSRTFRPIGKLKTKKCCVITLVLPSPLHSTRSLTPRLLGLSYLACFILWCWLTWAAW